jgi:tRNA 2-selenouridine synthase
MAMRMIPADQALTRLQAFDTIIDARSEAEFAEDRLPGAVNWPTLDDAQRASVGTEYKQVSAFDARKQGAVLAARNIATHIEQHVLGQQQGWKPLVYCWRGGQRSGSLGTVLGAIGFTVHVLEGGYREFRRAVVNDLQTLPAGLRFQVLGGRTGSAKSRLLHALAAEGAQVLDLEALAAHRGSVLGPLPWQAQPSQKAFDTAVWEALRSFNPDRMVFAESESRTIGRLRVPEPLLVRLRESPCAEVQMPLPERVAFLLEDYAHFVADTPAFCTRLDVLRTVQGHAVVDDWQMQAQAGSWAEVVKDLLVRHYDPVYDRSTARNYQQFGQAEPLALADGSAATLAAAARQLVSAAGQSAPASAHVHAAIAAEVGAGREA